MQQSKGNRRGRNFCLRLSVRDLERARLAGYGTAGPAALGPWLLWSAIDLRSNGDRAGIATVGNAKPGGALPGPGPGIAGSIEQLGQGQDGQAVPARRILDLCGGSGAWSKPYRDAGYQVDVITLPHYDVRKFQPAGHYHGILAAPPCTEFSIAKNGVPRDFAAGLETIVACLRVIAMLSPEWWALENPGSGLLRRWMGEPQDVFQPRDFGDDWTKLTALWGSFNRPARSHCKAVRGMPGNTAAARAVTPPGFAQAFFAANP